MQWLWGALPPRNETIDCNVVRILSVTLLGYLILFCVGKLLKPRIMPSVSGELDLHHPEPWEVMFSSEFSDRPPTMTWRYPEPRALSAVDLVPLPLSTPVLVNTLNMGDEYQVTLNTPLASFFSFSPSEWEIDSMLVKQGSKLKKNFSRHLRLATKI